MLINIYILYYIIYNICVCSHLAGPLLMMFIYVYMILYDPFYTCLHLDGLDDIHFRISSAKIIARNPRPQMLGKPDHAIGSRTQGLITREAICLHKGRKSSSPLRLHQLNATSFRDVSGAPGSPRIHPQFTIVLSSSTSELHNQQLSVMFNCSIYLYIVYLISHVWRECYRVPWELMIESQNLQMIQFVAWRWNSYSRDITPGLAMATWVRLTNVSLAVLPEQPGTSLSENGLPQFQWTIRIFPMTWPFRGIYGMPHFQI